MPVTISLRDLPLPCPLNALYMSIPVALGRRQFGKLVNTKRSRLCKAAVITAIRQQLGGDGPRLNRPCQLTYTITAPDRRPRDVDCYEKQLLDCLEAAGVVSDDVLIKQISKEMMPFPKRPGGISLELMELP